MNTVNINRVGSLLNYDWMLHKRTLTLTAILIPLIYIIIAFLAFVTNAEFDMSNGNSQLPFTMTMACKSYFGFAQWAGIIIITTLLTEKFCYPRTATSYLTLPGSSLEKVITMFAEYLIAFISIFCIYAVMHYATMGIGLLYAPDLNWGFSAFSDKEALNSMGVVNGNLDNLSVLMQNDGMSSDLSNLFADSLTDFIKASVWLTPFITIAEVTFYMVLNLFFKTNVQIKAIACCVVLYVALVLVTLFAFLGVLFSMGDNITPEMFLPYYAKIMTVLKYSMYASPFIACGLIYTFYRMVCTKQAK